MICPGCGKDIDDESLMCPECGYDILGASVHKVTFSPEVAAAASRRSSPIPGSINVFGIISAILMAISLFLPVHKMEVYYNADLQSDTGSYTANCFNFKAKYKTPEGQVLGDTANMLLVCGIILVIVLIACLVFSIINQPPMVLFSGIAGVLVSLVIFITFNTNEMKDLKDAAEQIKALCGMFEVNVRFYFGPFIGFYGIVLSSAAMIFSGIWMKNKY